MALQIKAGCARSQIGLNTGQGSNAIVYTLYKVGHTAAECKTSVLLHQPRWIGASEEQTFSESRQLAKLSNKPRENPPLPPPRPCPTSFYTPDLVSSTCRTCASNFARKFKRLLRPPSRRLRRRRRRQQRAWRREESYVEISYLAAPVAPNERTGRREGRRATETGGRRHLGNAS